MSDSDNPHTLSCYRLLLFLAPIVMDAWAVVSYYQEEDYVYMWVLLLFLIGSSVIGQVYSWRFYRDDDYKPQTTVENCLSPVALKTLHVFQMGVYLRKAGVVEVEVRNFFKKKGDLDAVVSLSHELGLLDLLRLIEIFTKSAPLSVLVLTVMIQRGMGERFTLLQLASKALVIANGVDRYHRAMLSFRPDKKEQTDCSTLVYILVYFLWNLLMIAARIAALSLFASVLPCFIFAHFLCSWMILFLVAWWLQTDFMKSVGGEWLYRATLGLIWYFSWFKAVNRRTRNWSILYHAWMMLDLVLLCGLWCWRSYCELPQPHYTFIVSSVIIAVYGIGLACKVMYYSYYPNMTKDPKCESVKSLDVPVEQDTEIREREREMNETDDIETEDRSMHGARARRGSKRMKKLSENFYSSFYS